LTLPDAKINVKILPVKGVLHFSESFKTYDFRISQLAAILVSWYKIGRDKHGVDTREVEFIISVIKIL
jgi:hypothetical protein